MEFITSRENKLVKKISMLNLSAKQRKKMGEFVCEGFRLCSELASDNIEFELLCVSDQYPDKYNDLVESLSKLARKSIQVPNELFEKISDTKSPQGVICVCKNDIIKNINPVKTGRYIALENVSDPSNMGTIIRTAQALGVDGLILSGDCCDILSPKVIRGSMGMIFRMSFLFVDNMPDYVLELNRCGFATYAGVVANADSLLTELDFLPGSVVLIGNEGNGLTKDTVANSSCRFTIPMKGKCESLNAATAATITMWELMK